MLKGSYLFQTIINWVSMLVFKGPHSLCIGETPSLFQASGHPCSLSAWIHQVASPEVWQPEWVVKGCRLAVKEVTYTTQQFNGG